MNEKKIQRKILQGTQHLEYGATSAISLELTEKEMTQRRNRNE